MTKVGNCRSFIQSLSPATMAANGFAHSAAPVRRVQEVQFGILSPDEIVRSWDMRVLEYAAN